MCRSYWFTQKRHTSPRRLGARKPLGKLVYRPTAVAAFDAQAPGSFTELLAAHSSKLQISHGVRFKKTRPVRCPSVLGMRGAWQKDFGTAMPTGAA